ncbi:MAG: DUF4174 domain-containing protein [Bacteroidetes bacterium]|nr:DUF4174 domain-containing protein [Fibrella sp.]
MKRYGLISLLAFTLVAVAMENTFSQKKSLAAQLAEKRDRRRIVLLYGRDSEASQQYLLDQQNQFARHREDLAERDLDVIVVVASTLTAQDRQFLTASPYKLDPATNFQGWLIGKDGGIKDRFDKPVSPQALFKQIDGMPMRRQEMKRNRG